MSDTTLAAARPFPIVGDAPGALARELRDNRIVYAILAAWIAYTAILALIRGDGFGAELAEYGGRALRAGTVLLCFTAVVVAVKVMVERPERLLGTVAARLVAVVSGPVVVRYAFGFAVFAVFMATFLYNKMLIPRIQPFAWDETFARWDQALFLGSHPWELIQPLVGTPTVTLFLDYIYVAWVPGVFLFWGWMLASPRVPMALRRRYWTATILSWVLLGIVMATFLSSAGPCFLPVLSPDLAGDYAPLNAYLARTHDSFILASGLTKQHLWEVYTGVSGEPGGISAMPSMHNAQAALFALAAYRVHRGFGHVMAAYAALILVASVALAWHYAVDGLIGVAGAGAIWWIAGLVAGDRKGVA